MKYRIAFILLVPTLAIVAWAALTSIYPLRRVGASCKRVITVHKGKRISYDVAAYPGSVVCIQEGGCVVVTSSIGRCAR